MGVIIGGASGKDRIFAMNIGVLSAMEFQVTVTVAGMIATDTVILQPITNGDAQQGLTVQVGNGIFIVQTADGTQVVDDYNFYYVVLR